LADHSSKHGEIKEINHNQNEQMTKTGLNEVKTSMWLAVDSLLAGLLKDTHNMA